MNINDFRKFIFINSQYCNHYEVGNNTVVAGIMRNIGYLYQQKLTTEQISAYNKEYRKYTTIVNSVVALEILLYIYAVIFPYFIKFMEQSFFITTLMLSTISLLALYLTYIVANSFFEKYLIKTFGQNKKTKFSPTIKNIDESSFQKYVSTPRKSIYLMLLVIAIFVGYVVTPLYVNNLNTAKKYKYAVSLANAYLKIVPISPNVYAQRAYAKFKLKQYKEAIADYELANKYSLSDSFFEDIIGVKTYYLPYKTMLAEFDKAISIEESEPAQYLLRYEKAVYQLKNKDYKSAYLILNDLVGAYEQKKDVHFSPSFVYFNRGIAREALGDINGANIDKRTAKKMCPECQFNQETTLINRL